MACRPEVADAGVQTEGPRRRRDSEEARDSAEVRAAKHKAAQLEAIHTRCAACVGGGLQSPSLARVWRVSAVRAQPPACTARGTRVTVCTVVTVAKCPLSPMAARRYDLPLQRHGGGQRSTHRGRRGAPCYCLGPRSAVGSCCVMRRLRCGAGGLIGWLGSRRCRACACTVPSKWRSGRPGTRRHAAPTPTARSVAAHACCPPLLVCCYARVLSCGRVGVWACGGRRRRPCWLRLPRSWSCVARRKCASLPTRCVCVPLLSHAGRSSWGLHCMR